MKSEHFMMAVSFFLLSIMVGRNFVEFESKLAIPILLLFLAIGFLGILVYWDRFSVSGRKRQEIIERARSLPPTLLSGNEEGVCLGYDENLGTNIFLPDSVRCRHVHVLGGTGTGKTESVILNFLRQDLERGVGSIILDAKGEYSFLRSLRSWVPSDRLVVFDLASADETPYNSLAVGSPLEAAQRLFSTLNWSEEYYKSKAFTALVRLFEAHHSRLGKNPTFLDLAKYLRSAEAYQAFVSGDKYSGKSATKDYEDLSGLKDQVGLLAMDVLEKILSPKEGGIALSEAAKGKVIYFRLQSLLSSELVSTVGKLIIKHLNYLAGTAHRSDDSNKKIVPVYLDEFAAFACPEFADLISMARSARYALHFSHQSIGQLREVSDAFLCSIVDNAATKIVLRITDPDSADYLARCFGTKIYQKVTKRVTNVDDVNQGELVGEGSQREAHQFRASPDLFKNLPVGVGSVLIAHGADAPSGASAVFQIRFPHLKKEGGEEA